MYHKKQDVRRTPQPLKKSAKTEKPTVEIDLHINQLLDTTEGMSAGEMLSYQMNKFHETLKQYASKKGQKIVFIHGKGEGVLRTAIEKELKTRYKSHTFQDASFQEYGFGATMVKIR
jgi:dsDNA-specific endonuclease/ATPase MutS2